jgi:hypothetical protein
MRTERAPGTAARRSILWGAAGAALTCVVGGLIVGCGPGEAKAPNPTRPLAERRAIEVIRRAMKKEGVDPAPGRDEKIAGNGAPVHIDVGVQGRSYGVAYVTDEEAEALATAASIKNDKGGKLRLVQAGDDGETHVAVLFAQNYLYDDQVGEGHELTTISAENALARDVQDFITHAREKKYK